MKIRSLLLQILTGCSALALAACSQPTPPSPEVPAEGRVGIVTETMTGGNYDFLCVESEGRAYWLATVPNDAVVGDRVQYGDALVMKDFYSPSLDRRFPAILFVNDITVIGKGESGAKRTRSLPSGHPLVPDAAPRTPVVERPAAGSIPRPPGSPTVAELASGLDQWEGKELRIVGKVMKVNHDIMGTNWIHLEDGTSWEDVSDLRVTSSESPALGSIITAVGTVAVNKNFQGGYFVPVLLEDARVEQVAATAH